MMIVYVDRFGRGWYPYYLQDLQGETNTVLHPAGADTDMADCDLSEVVEWFGPVTVEVR